MGKDVAKRILLISLEKWPHCCRYPKALKAAGFHVSVCAFKNDPIHLSTYIDTRMIVPETVKTEAQAMGSLADAVDKGGVDFILPLDDLSARVLVGLYERSDNEDLKALIETSRGDVAYFEQCFNKHKTVALAGEIGVRVPEQTECAAFEDVTEFASKHGYPLVLKNPLGSAGVLVLVCDDEAAAKNNFEALHAKGSVIAQAYIQGQPAMANGCALNGRVLACMTLLKSQCYPEKTGPSCVLDLIDHKEMKQAAEAFIARTGYSGVFSLDFMLDGKKRAYLIECNARPVPISHLGGRLGADVFSALYKGLSGQNYKPAKADLETVALFPKELARDPQSAFLHEAYHDVPWDEPKIVDYMLRLAYQSRQ